MNGSSQTLSRLAMVLLLVALVLSASLVNNAKAESVRSRVLIRSDGTISPDDAPIRRMGDVYTFTGNVYAEISVQRSNIIIDGGGYTLQGTFNGTNESAFMIGQGPDQVSNDTKVPWSIGIDLAFPQVTGLTVRNLNIKNFSIGMYVWTENNVVAGNAITDTIVGVLLSGSNNTISRNYVARNKEGIFFGWSEGGKIPSTIVISGNSFDRNERHISGCVCKDYNMTETPHYWDNGKEGNYWSDYVGVDSDFDGIGDKPYVIDVLNQDRFPLMRSPVNPPAVAFRFPVELATAIVVLMVVAAVVVVQRRRVLKRTT